MLPSRQPDTRRVYLMNGDCGQHPALPRAFPDRPTPPGEAAGSGGAPVDHASHATAVRRNGLSAIVVAAALGPPAEHARDLCWR
jgi:hypothetical protein